MKHFLVLVFMFFAFNVQAATPFHPYEEVRFSAIENGSAIQSKKFNIKPSGTTYASGSTVTLGTLPANAVIYKDFIYVQTKLAAATDTATTTLALQCKSANDLLTATNLLLAGYASGTLINGARNFPNTATATAVETGAGCTVAAKVGTGETITSGELELTVEYILY